MTQNSHHLILQKLQTKIVSISLKSYFLKTKNISHDFPHAKYMASYFGTYIKFYWDTIKLIHMYVY